MSIKMYKLDPAKFLSTPGLAWKAAIKKTKVKIDLLTDIVMLLMVEKGLWGGTCHSIYQYAKASNKYMKNYDKNKEAPYIQYCDVNNLYGWENVARASNNTFEWIKDISQNNEDFIKKTATQKVM